MLIHLAGLTDIAPPPTGMEMRFGPQLIFTVWLVIPTIIALVLGVRAQIRDRNPMLLLCLAGGAVASVIEPVVDVLGGAFYPPLGNWTAFVLMGVHVPLFIPLAYTWYIGGQAYLALRALSRGDGARSICTLYGAFMLSDVILEQPGLLTGVYAYYGNQPLNLWGYPFWWAPANAAVPVLAAAIIYKIRPNLTGYRLGLVVVLFPMADAAANGFVAWPAWMSLHSGWPTPLAWVMGVVVYGFGALLVLVVLSATGRLTAVPASQALPNPWAASPAASIAAAAR